MNFTAYALTTHGPAVIECYPSLAAAVADVLGLWPEDPESDVRIVDGRGRGVAYLRHNEDDPALCTLTFDDRDGGATYRCKYTTGPTGRVRAVARRIAWDEAGSPAPSPRACPRPPGGPPRPR